jgi:PAS domain S-box-containing protein
VIGQEAATYFEGAQDTYERVQPLFNGQSDVFYVESWQRRQDGEKRLLAWWCRSIVDAYGKVTGALSTARDITESRLAEAAIREAEEKYRNIFESTLIGIFRTTPDGRYIIVNPAYASILGYDSPESLMQEVQDIGAQLYLDPNERARLLELLERQDEIKGYETRVVRKDGKVVDVRVDDSVMHGPDGQVLYYQGTVLDITERKRAEEALRASEDKFSKAFRQSPDILVISRMKDGLIYETNDSWERILGHPREELIGHSSLEIGMFVDPEQRQLAVDKLKENGFLREFEVAVYSKSGTIHQVELSIENILIGDELCMLTILHDVTERKQAEKALRERAEELQRRMDTAPIAILMARDPECQVITGNQAANRIYGASEGANISVSVSGELQPPTRRFFQNGRELLPEEHPIQQATAKGVEVQNAEVEVLLPGGKMITMLGTASPLFDSERRVRGAVAAFMDITERKKIEEKLRALLAEKETLLREVHHRVKNNLQAIVYLIEMQSAHLSDEASRQFLRELEEQARTMSLVYEQVYQSENLARIGMASYLEKLAENVLVAFGRGRSIRLDLDIAPIALNVERAMPCGLIVNELVTNSLKYAFQADCQDQPAIQISLQAVGEFYRLRVGDNGAGLSPNLDWQTSRSLGLRLVRLWATHQLGGKIELNGESGTSFEITFSTTGK